MRLAQWCLIVGVFAIRAASFAQSDAALTTKQLMLERIHPAANDILLVAFRGAADRNKDWAHMRESARALALSANLLSSRNPQPDWTRAARLLSSAASEAVKAANAKDTKALAAIAARIDASCTDCHKHYRPNIFPPATKGPGQ